MYGICVYDNEQQDTGFSPSNNERSKIIRNAYYPPGN